MQNQRRKFHILVCLVIILVVTACTQPEVLSTTTLASKTVTVTLAPTKKSTLTLTAEQPRSTELTHVPFNTQILPTPAPGEPRLLATFGTGDCPCPGNIPVFSPDGQILALANQTISFWNVSTFELLQEIQTPYLPGCWLYNAEFSPDGRLFAVSISGCWIKEREKVGHLLVWDIETGELLRDWKQVYADMFQPGHRPYLIPVHAMLFLQGSQSIAFASGNTIEIRSIKEDSEPVVFRLGDGMYASEISVRDDFEFLNVLMRWHKINTFPALYSTEYKAQIWHLNTGTLRIIEEFEDLDDSYEEMALYSNYLLRENRRNATLEARNLATHEIINLPFRSGWMYLSPDLSLMVYARIFLGPDGERAIEFWDTDTWRNKYTFWPASFPKDIYSMKVAFNPSNPLVAIAYKGRVTLWDIAPVVNP